MSSQGTPLGASTSSDQSSQYSTSTGEWSITEDRQRVANIADRAFGVHEHRRANSWSHPGDIGSLLPFALVTPLPSPTPPREEVPTWTPSEAEACFVKLLETPNLDPGKVCDPEDLCPENLRLLEDLVITNGGFTHQIRYFDHVRDSRAYLTRLVRHHRAEGSLWMLLRTAAEFREGMSDQARPSSIGGWNPFVVGLLQCLVTLEPKEWFGETCVQEVSEELRRTDELETLASRVVRTAFQPGLTFGPMGIYAFGLLRDNLNCSPDQVSIRFQKLVYLILLPEMAGSLASRQGSQRQSGANSGVKGVASLLLTHGSHPDMAAVVERNILRAAAVSLPAGRSNENGVSLENLVQRYGAASSKSQFVRGLLEHHAQQGTLFILFRSALDQILVNNGSMAAKLREETNLVTDLIQAYVGQTIGDKLQALDAGFTTAVKRHPDFASGKYLADLQVLKRVEDKESNGDLLADPHSPANHFLAQCREVTTKLLDLELPGEWPNILAMLQHHAPAEDQTLTVTILFLRGINAYWNSREVADQASPKAPLSKRLLGKSNSGSVDADTLLYRVSLLKFLQAVANPAVAGIPQGAMQRAVQEYEGDAWNFVKTHLSKSDPAHLPEIGTIVSPS